MCCITLTHTHTHTLTKSNRDYDRIRNISQLNFIIGIALGRRNAVCGEGNNCVLTAEFVASCCVVYFHLFSYQWKWVRAYWMYPLELKSKCHRTCSAQDCRWRKCEWNSRYHLLFNSWVTVKLQYKEFMLTTHWCKFVVASVVVAACSLVTYSFGCWMRRANAHLFFMLRESWENLVANLNERTRANTTEINAEQAHSHSSTQFSEISTSSKCTLASEISWFCALLNCGANCVTGGVTSLTCVGGVNDLSYVYEWKFISWIISLTKLWLNAAMLPAIWYSASLCTLSRII